MGVIWLVTQQLQAGGKLVPAQPSRVGYLPFFIPECASLVECQVVYGDYLWR